MAGLEEYEAALQALMRQFENPASGEASLSWLGVQIHQQLRTAEDEARPEWEAHHPEGPNPETFVSPDNRLQIALEVMYHELVSLPRMLAHVQHFWSSQPAQYHVRLLGSATGEPIRMDAISATTERLRWLHQFVQRLVDDYQLDQLRNFLRRLEEADSDEH